MTSTSSSSISTDLLIDFPRDELDLPLDGDVGACFSGNLLTLLDRLLDGLLLGDVVAGLFGDLATLSAGHLDRLLLTLLSWLGVTGLYRHLAAALLGLLTTLGSSVPAAVGGLGGLALRHVGGGALLLVAGGAHLLVLRGALLLVLRPGALGALQGGLNL